MKAVKSFAYEIFRSCLKEARKESGLTQLELAEALGTEQSYISKIERGERRLDTIELIYVCQALGISPARFIQRIENRLSGAQFK